ncbi:MAG: ATP-binding protein [Hyphomicrobiaceae bacterium]
MLSLRRFLISILAFVVAAPMAIYWAWPHSSALQNAVDEVHERHLLIARNLSIALERYHRDATATFDYAADAILQGDTFPRIDRLLQNLQFMSICLVEAKSGAVITGLDGTASCPKQVPADLLATFSALAVENKTVMSGVHGAPSGPPRFCLVRKSGDRMVLGVLATNYIVDLGKAIAFGQKGHAAIVDQHGKVLAHPLPAWIASMRDISKLPVVKRMLAGEQGVETFYSPALKDDMIAGFSSVARAGWGVMVPQPLAELRETAHRIQWSMFLVVAAGIVIAALVGGWMALLLAAPITEVTRAARKMATGDSQVRLKALSAYHPREFCELTTAFNVMADRVAAARDAETSARMSADAANATLQEKLKLLERSNRDLKDFAHVAAHDLQEPLRKIEAFGTRLQERCGAELGEDGAMFLGRMQDATLRMRRLITDLLAYARLEHANDALRTVDLNAVLHGVLSDLQVRIEETHAQIVADQLPSIEAQPAQMRQLLQNLIANALKFRKPDVAPVIKICGIVQCDAQNANRMLHLSIADNGIGFDPGSKEKLFKIFQRLHGRHEYEGTGVGLATCRRIVENHGGSIDANGTPGEGTVFTITLPVTHGSAGKMQHRQYLRTPLPMPVASQLRRFSSGPRQPSRPSVILSRPPLCRQRHRGRSSGVAGIPTERLSRSSRKARARRPRSRTRWPHRQQLRRGRAASDRHTQPRPPRQSSSPRQAGFRSGLWRARFLPHLVPAQAAVETAKQAFGHILRAVSHAVGNENMAGIVSQPHDLPSPPRHCPAPPVSPISFLSRIVVCVSVSHTSTGTTAMFEGCGSVDQPSSPRSAPYPPAAKYSPVKGRSSVRVPWKVTRFIMPLSACTSPGVASANAP